jgi:diguanylate cyclase (GGDEF)-like protein
MSAFQRELRALDEEHSAGALERLESLDRESNRILAGALIVSPLAIAIFGLLWLVLRGYQRRDEVARVAEIRRLEHAALTDNLTELRNQRAFEEDLARELKRQERSGGSLSLVMLDVDELKQINDTFGHQEGDARLRALAACMRESTRGSDSAYRIGGDEFALILPDSPAIGALGLARRIQEQLSAGSRTPRPRATAGIAETTGPLTVDELTRRADLALYDAKRSQREVVIYGSALERVGAPPESRSAPSATSRCWRPPWPARSTSRTRRHAAIRRPSPSSRG